MDIENWFASDDLNDAILHQINRINRSAIIWDMFGILITGCIGFGIDVLLNYFETPILLVKFGKFILPFFAGLATFIDKEKCDTIKDGRFVWYKSSVARYTRNGIGRQAFSIITPEDECCECMQSSLDFKKGDTIYVLKSMDSQPIAYKIKH